MNQALLAVLAVGAFFAARAASRGGSNEVPFLPPPPPPPPPEPSPATPPASSPAPQEAVRQVQRQLNAIRAAMLQGTWSGSSVDDVVWRDVRAWWARTHGGANGPSTAPELAQWQEQQPWAPLTVDGLLGPKTAGALGAWRAMLQQFRADNSLPPLHAHEEELILARSTGLEPLVLARLWWAAMAVGGSGPFRVGSMGSWASLPQSAAPAPLVAVMVRRAGYYLFTLELADGNVAVLWPRGNDWLTGAPVDALRGLALFLNRDEIVLLRHLPAMPARSRLFIQRVPLGVGPGIAPPERPVRVNALPRTSEGVAVLS